MPERLIKSNHPDANKPDDLEQVHSFLKDYGQTIIIAVGVAIAVVLGIGAYRNYKKSTDMRASQMLMGAQSPEQLQQIVNQYPSTPSAPLALLALGARYFDSGQYDLARFAYAQFEQKHPEHPMIKMAALGQAQCFEAEGQIDQALDGFTAFAAANPGHFLEPLAVFGKARCLMELGRYDDARVAYEDFIAANPESGWMPLAESALLFVDKESRAQAKAGGKPVEFGAGPMESPVFLDPTVPSGTTP